MRLKNKNTGEIIRFYDGIRLNGEDYDSLAELNEEWEDYEPKEPLIKDEVLCMEKIIKQIIDWGNEKGINNPVKQFNKLAEEMLEAHEAYTNLYNPLSQMMLRTSKQIGLRYQEDLLEELGDIGVVWILLCNMLKVSPQEALEAAHNKNKVRKGKTINGNFIKEEDLKE